MASDAASLEAMPAGYKPVPERPDFGESKLLTVIIVCCSLIGLAIWGSFAKIDSATAAPGELRVESHRKEVKLLEAGVVRRLLVEEGDHVDIGQPLIELDPTKIDADVEVLRQQFFAALARTARLWAQAYGGRAIKFPEELLLNNGQPSVQELLGTESALFRTQQAALNTRREVLRNRMGQLQTRVSATDGRIAAAHEQIELISDELISMEFLLCPPSAPLRQIKGFAQGRILVSSQ